VLEKLATECYRQIQKGTLPNFFVYKKTNSEDSLSKSKEYEYGNIYIQQLYLCLFERFEYSCEQDVF
jgi:hypothetical protein